MNDTLGADPPVRYLRRAEGNIGAATFERAVDDLMSQLLERLSSRGAEADDLTEVWNAVQEERRCPDETRRRRREAILGLDPDEMSADELADVVSSKVQRTTNCCLSRSLRLRARKCSVLSPRNS
ncbi:MAG: hypothetical protein R6V85_20315 [Polyangia bacterium]